jgi:hypothetical protein
VAGGSYPLFTARLAKAVIDQISQIEDLDRKLRLDQQLKDKMLVSSANLLRPLGYNIDEYRMFASED